MPLRLRPYQCRWPVLWLETPGQIALHFGAPRAADAPALALENGVREVLTESASGGAGTCRLEFERATGNKVVTAYGPSMGTTANAIPIRLERGEPRSLPGA